MKQKFWIAIMLLLSFLIAACSNQANTQNEQNGGIVGSAAKQISYEEAHVIFNRAHENFVQALDNQSDLLQYYMDTNPLTLDEISDYELKWKELENDLRSIQNSLIEVTPPELYAELWHTFADYMGDLADECCRATDLDVNHDNQYTDNEMYDLLYDVGTKYIDISTAAHGVALELEKIAINPAESTATNLPKSEEVSYPCTECGKNAPCSYENPFSGETEYYCETHYQELLDIIGEMEEDVGNSNQNKQTCEECSREGTYRYESFTGQTEYYCTKHYEELMDMLDSFGLD